MNLQEDQNPNNVKYTSFKCNCKKSKCLKLYCECFGANTYCKDCNCNNCQNNPQTEIIRQDAIKQAMEKNPNIFQTKKKQFEQVQNSDNSNLKQLQEQSKQTCQCKSSNCIKKYCVCYQQNQMCNSNCKCIECLNTDKINSNAQKSNFNLPQQSKSEIQFKEQNLTNNKSVEEIVKQIEEVQEKSQIDHHFIAQISYELLQLSQRTREEILEQKDFIEQYKNIKYQNYRNEELKQSQNQLNFQEQNDYQHIQQIQQEEIQNIQIDDEQIKQLVLNSSDEDFRQLKQELIQQMFQSILLYIQEKIV